jgi:aldehyde dehydrogenase
VDIDAKEIERIVRSVLRETAAHAPAQAGSAARGTMAAAPAAAARQAPAARLAPGIFANLDDAVGEADRARRGIRKVSDRLQAVAAIRRAGEQHARELAEMAVTETGMGRVEDKTEKNLSQARLTPGLECLQARALTGDHGLTLIENAAWGVIASVTPSTNPVATVINNAISMVAAGNSVVFAPHPAARKCSQRAISLINESILAAGGPGNLLTTVAEPTIEIAQRLFRYPGINLLTVTGGEAVIHEARKHTDKRLIAAGAGNPPVVVDETADVPRAARDIVWGASFDNNIICVDEKEVIAVSQICDQLKSEMKKHRAVEITMEQARRLQDELVSNVGPEGKGTVNRKWVGRDACRIAESIGLSVPADTRLLFVEVPRDHPFAVTELMMPVLPVVRAASADEAIDIAIALEAGNRHTAAMHSRNLDNLDRMANEINTSIFVKNGPCLAGLGFGGEGWTTMTISTPTGEGVTSAATFVRLRRCVLVDNFRIV